MHPVKWDTTNSNEQNMVKRRPHTAFFETPAGEVINGKWVEGESETFPINGRFDQSAGGYIFDSNGDRVNIEGVFYTDCPKIADVGFLSINGVKFRVIRWVTMQTYSKIEIAKI